MRLKIRLSDGLIQYEYTETAAEPRLGGRLTVQRASRVDPVPESSPPRFAIHWQPPVADVLGPLTDTEADGSPLLTYSQAVRREQQLLRERYLDCNPVPGTAELL